jgi:PAS domain S-box-containing protein
MAMGEAVGIGEDNSAVRGDPGDLAFDISRDLICTAGDEGRFTSVNAAWETTLGWSREALMSQPLIDFVHPEDADRTRVALARVAERDRELIAFETRFRTRAGEYRWLHWNARSDGEIWFAVVFDVTERKRTERQVLEAIEDGRLLAYGQPIVEPSTGRIVQEELLVRLRMDGGGRVALPSEFLPAAERSGTILAIDEWMVRKGLALAERGRHVEINLSARSIANEDLMNELAERVAGIGIAARRLVFEITETAALENLAEAQYLAERLGRLGALIALDDFGTGFASLTNLRQLPVQILKIDASFVGGMSASVEDRALVRGIAAIAKELRLQTVAEGVEDVTTYELLRGYRVDRAQGYLIGRPIPV